MWKVVPESTTFILWLTENLGLISTLENIRCTEMDNY